MLSYDDLHWWSDWNGYEVGYPEIPVVGYYAMKLNPRVAFYIDTENERILEVLIEDDV